MALKKVTWYGAPQVINENFEEIEENMIEAAATIALLTSTNLTVVPALADTAAVKTYLDTLVPQIESRLDAVEGKINALITNFKASGAIES